jgi:hypothetical protein
MGQIKNFVSYMLKVPCPAIALARCYYESEAKVPIAIDPETEGVRVLEPLKIQSRNAAQRSRLNQLRAECPARVARGAGVRADIGRIVPRDPITATPAKTTSKKLSPLDFEMVRTETRLPATM